ncbi:hypothetical protein EYF80_056040 [Liparis tanakae]|uniref:Uncharacterized protein n=1 Tax=Liparis tanakae TaxID=230148 RepID=A0A4Z2EZI0_9TELE|nr:hypothetical protein EYF80_056040 [Liparis tanakae]
MPHCSSLLAARLSCSSPRSLSEEARTESRLPYDCPTSINRSPSTSHWKPLSTHGGHPQRLHRRGSDAQQDLGSNQQQVHHVGVGPVVAHVVFGLLGVGSAGVGANVPAHLGPRHLPDLVLLRQELGQSREQGAERHDDAPAADQTGPVGFGPEVADEQDQSQVPDLEAAGDHADVGALQVEPPLQGRQHTHLKTTGDDVNPESRKVKKHEYDTENPGSGCTIRVEKHIATGTRSDLPVHICSDLSQEKRAYNPGAAVHVFIRSSELQLFIGIP